jgi:uncharacterized protein (TIGR04222 family)
MNPFDWRGPEFLLFYLLLAAVALAAEWWLKRVRESSPGEAFSLGNPYLIAYLQGAEPAVARAAIASLIARDAMVNGGRKLAVKRRAEDDLPVEKAVLVALRDPIKHTRAVSKVCANSDFQKACGEFQTRAERANLVPGTDVLKARRRDQLIVLIVLAGVAIVKMTLAVSRGHGNIWLLVLLSASACVAATLISRGRLTTFGQKTLEDVRHLYAEMPARVNAGSLTSQEIGMTAGLFGLGLLGVSGMAGAALHKEWGRNPNRTRESGSSSDSECGSSDSSSSCSSSSSSCSSSSSSSCGGCSST